MLQGGPTPDLVITDVRMPRVVGPASSCAPRAGGGRGSGCCSCPATPATTRRTGFLEAGDRLLGKPFTAETLLDVVRDLLRRRRGSGADRGGAPGDRHLQAVPRSV